VRTTLSFGKLVLLGLIEDYWQGLLPKIVPLALLKHHLMRRPSSPDSPWAVPRLRLVQLQWQEVDKVGAIVPARSAVAPFFDLETDVIDGLERGE
jgi:hypothetical protein